MYYTMPVWIMGMLGGLIGGSVMGMFLTTEAPYRNFGKFSTPAKLVTAAFGGTNALDGGFGSILTGAAIHYTLSMVLGVIFAILMAAFNLIQLPVEVAALVLIGAGLIYASIIFFTVEYLILPFTDRPLMLRIPFADFGLAHMIFGGLLGWSILIFR